MKHTYNLKLDDIIVHEAAVSSAFLFFLFTSAFEAWCKISRGRSTASASGSSCPAFVTEETPVLQSSNCQLQTALPAAIEAATNAVFQRAARDVFQIEFAVRFVT